MREENWKYGTLKENVTLTFLEGIQPSRNVCVKTLKATDSSTIF